MTPKSQHVFFLEGIRLVRAVGEIHWGPPHRSHPNSTPQHQSVLWSSATNVLSGPVGTPAAAFLVYKLTGKEANPQLTRERLIAIEVICFSVAHLSCCDRCVAKAASRKQR